MKPHAYDKVTSNEPEVYTTHYRIKRQLENIFALMTFNSRMIEEYYQEASLERMKDNFRNGVKVILFAWYLKFIMDGYFLPHFVFSVTLTSMLITFVLVIYVLSLVVKKTYIFTKLAFWTMTLFYTTSFFIHYHVTPIIETNYTPLVQINLFLFSNLNLHFNVLLTLSILSLSFIVYSSIMEIDRHNRAHEVGQSDQTNKNSYFVINYVNIWTLDYNSARALALLFFFCISLLMVTFYFYMYNNLRRRAAFVRLGQSRQSKLDLKQVVREQLQWIEAIMPKVVKKEYWDNREKVKAETWIYIKNFHNVSILFADIVGFTKMSSNKSALKVVTLLNDLFNRFDQLCMTTNCEKLGTLGDCYYCVAGCPRSIQDHTNCCVEMGLGMCRIIQVFNLNYGEDVNMRVGVHTGRVNAAIIGKRRFKFDVYSNDVIIANLMESSGKPGRVHISHKAYENIKGTYRFEHGEDVAIQVEESRGLAGMQLNTIKIKTYYVKQHSTATINDDNIQATKARPINVLRKSRSGAPDASSENEEEESFSNDEEDVIKVGQSKKQMLEKLQLDVQFIESIRFDYEQKVRLFAELPLNYYSKQFRDPEIEWHFLRYLETEEDISVDSLRYVPFINGLVSTIFSTLFFIAVISLYPDDAIHDYLCILVVFIYLLSLCCITFLLFWCAYKSHYKFSDSLLRYMYILFSHYSTHLFLGFYYVTVPLIILIVCYYNCEKFLTNYANTIEFFTLLFFVLIHTPIYSTCHYFFKVFLLVLNFGIVAIILWKNDCSLMDVQMKYERFNCLGIHNITDRYFYGRIATNYQNQLMLLFMVLLLIMREMERNTKLWFLIYRDTQIYKEEASLVMKYSNELLYNIIPKYVMDNITNKNVYDGDKSKFSYATSVPRAGVVFACISNFFSQYYREDYEGGSGALKLLHKIICMFDNLLDKKIYKDVEKIKTINDCYMVASGLNAEEAAKNNFKFAHLYSLMDYCFDLIKTLHFFNENFMFGSHKFEIKIGYNFGPVTAGIIGSTKPMYDIWGDTVNVSSRMYSTGLNGQIQVPYYVANQLNSTVYTFKLRGEIFVKGKGDMKTFICTKQTGPNPAARMSVMRRNTFRAI